MFTCKHASWLWRLAVALADRVPVTLVDADPQRSAASRIGEGARDRGGKQVPEGLEPFSSYLPSELRVTGEPSRFTLCCDNRPSRV